jgi:hypothetical protein
MGRRYWAGPERLLRQVAYFQRNNEGVNGGAGGVRTRDLLDAIEARSQLRYGPTLDAASKL